MAILHFGAGTVKQICKGWVIMPLLKERIYTSDDYWNLPDGHRAELIKGRLYNMALPYRIHQKLIKRFSQKITNYIDAKQGSCELYPAPFAVNLNTDDKNWAEPDISVICGPDKLTDRGCPPDHSF